MVIRLKHLRRGDLVFWCRAVYSYHVAIYVGHRRVIHAPHAGDIVRYGSMKGAWIGGRLLPMCSGAPLHIVSAGLLDLERVLAGPCP